MFNSRDGSLVIAGNAAPQPYSLLFFGHDTVRTRLALDECVDCYQQVTLALDHHLKQLPHIKYGFFDNQPRKFGWNYRRLPRADVVLFLGFPTRWTYAFDRERLKRATRCKAIITMT